VSRRVGGDRALAEDLVQDTWLRAVDDWRAHGLPREPLAWLTRVARNTLVSYFRRIRPEPVDPAVLDAIAREDAPGVVWDEPDTASAITWGVARLRRSHAEVLEEFYFAGRSVRDIARSQGLSERAVEGRLRRARAKLRTVLERIQPGAGSHAAQAEGGTDDVRPT
jgi:RNA polymerase sigma-70 factor (ECF subfamily)